MLVPSDAEYREEVDEFFQKTNTNKSASRQMSTINTGTHEGIYLKTKSD